MIMARHLVNISGTDVGLRCYFSVFTLDLVIASSLGFIKHVFTCYHISANLCKRGYFDIFNNLIYN